MFGPLSFSLRRLWSCAVGSNTYFFPSHSAKTETSGPWIFSSKTTTFPELPNFPLKIDSAASKHSSFESGIKTPLPEAKPSALTTNGVDDVWITFLAS